MSDRMVRTRSHAGSEKSTEESGTADSLQLSLDEYAAQRRRESGTSAAELNTYTPHRDLFLEIIEQLAEAGSEFTSDDVIERTGHHPIGGTGALGAIFQGACRRGIIEPVGFARSRRAERNGGWNRLWRGVPGGGA